MRLLLMQPGWPKEFSLKYLSKEEDITTHSKNNYLYYMSDRFESQSSNRKA